MSTDREWPGHIMGPKEQYLVSEEELKKTPTVEYIGPLVVDGITFPHMRAEHYRDPPGFYPAPSGRWRCACGWEHEYGMRHTYSRAPSPEYLAAFAEAFRRVLWHAERCAGEEAQTP